jgi:cytidylate kinase
MGNKMIMTIGREFGAEGHEIGKELSMRLGIPLYDKDLLVLAAKQSGISIETLRNADEVVTKRFLTNYIPQIQDNYTLNDKLFKVESNIIRDLSEKGSCIIIGRLADYILKDNPDCIRVFIYAPFEDRVRIIKEKHGVSEEAAKKLVKHMDSARDNYYSYYSKGKWNHKEGKDILLNRTTFGVEGCVNILEGIAKSKLV